MTVEKRAFGTLLIAAIALTITGCWGATDHEDPDEIISKTKQAIAEFVLTESSFRFKEISIMRVEGNGREISQETETEGDVTLPDKQRCKIVEMFSVNGNKEIVSEYDFITVNRGNSFFIKSDQLAGEGFEGWFHFTPGQEGRKHFSYSEVMKTVFNYIQESSFEGREEFNGRETQKIWARLDPKAMIIGRIQEIPGMTERYDLEKFSRMIQSFEAVILIDTVENLPLSLIIEIKLIDDEDPEGGLMTIKTDFSFEDYGIDLKPLIMAPEEYSEAPSY